MTLHKRFGGVLAMMFDLHAKSHLLHPNERQMVEAFVRKRRRRMMDYKIYMLKFLNPHHQFSPTWRATVQPLLPSYATFMRKFREMELEKLDAIQLQDVIQYAALKYTPNTHVLIHVEPTQWLVLHHAQYYDNYSVQGCTTIPGIIQKQHWQKPGPIWFTVALQVPPKNQVQFFRQYKVDPFKPMTFIMRRSKLRIWWESVIFVDISKTRRACYSLTIK
tara:strand:- start:10177 stop:10833 length:657 start_codon:yes stop_codon:yes gene_type:complete